MSRLYRRRLPQLLVGLWLYGATMALIVRAGLGLDPWDVLHQGLTKHLPLSFGAVTALVGIVALLAWIPLRQKPGIGTILNIIVIAISVDVTLDMISAPDALGTRWALLAVGVVGNGLAGALYVGAALGPGPRDGLWVAIVGRTERSVRQVRTALEVTVLVTGFLLGGSVGVGTLIYALAIGHVVQFFLPRVRVLEVEEAPVSGAAPSAGQRRTTAPQPAKGGRPRFMIHTAAEAAVTLRPAGPGDARELARVAELDSRPVPTGDVLVGLLDGRIVAAVSVDDGHTVADPFVPTAELVAMLRGRVRAIRVAAGLDGGARPVGSRLRTARAPFIG